jgi:hypothetical protein
MNNCSVASSWISVVFAQEGGNGGIGGCGTFVRLFKRAPIAVIAKMAPFILNYERIPTPQELQQLFPMRYLGKLDNI